MAPMISLDFEIFNKLKTDSYQQQKKKKKKKKKPTQHWFSQW
jgi:hypothetical protein